MSNSNKFIVVFKEGTAQEVVDAAAADVNAKGGEIKQRYDGTVLLGFSAVIHDSHFSTLQADPNVDYIEADGIVSVQQ
ncbi:serine proteinase inhibitor IA-1 [Blastocladiella britannica]|nr:serine proteinase inhibitor IA-1 [Blastocladiella britannica]